MTARFDAASRTAQSWSTSEHTCRSTWLRQHPEAEIIVRNRPTEYARGITEGRPEALQILDRWHALENVREVFERYLGRHQNVLKAFTDVPLRRDGAGEVVRAERYKGTPAKKPSSAPSRRCELRGSAYARSRGGWAAAARLFSRAMPTKPHDADGTPRGARRSTRTSITCIGDGWKVARTRRSCCERSKPPGTTGPAKR